MVNLPEQEIHLIPKLRTFGAKPTLHRVRKLYSCYRVIKSDSMGHDYDCITDLLEFLTRNFHSCMIRRRVRDINTFDTVS
jgi:hypothetical protein